MISPLATPLPPRGREVIVVGWFGNSRRARLMLGVAVVACGIALVWPSAAHAGWPLASDARATLAFGATYRAADATASSTHRGVDLAASSGARVLAPLSGEVAFVGLVPGVGGGSVRAVTIATVAGSLTLLPLEGVSVARGAHVSAGDEIAAVAADGDGSSDDTHLHVGLKRGELYLDPLGVMSPPMAAAEGGWAAQPVAVSKRVGSGVRAGVGAHAVSGTGVSAGAAAAVPTRVAAPGTKLAPGVSVGRAPIGAGVAGPQPVAVPTLSLPSLAGSHTEGGPSLAPLLERAADIARRSARGAMWALLGVLAALAALWPVWRRDPLQGLGKVGVSVGGDDVAAVSGR